MFLYLKFIGNINFFIGFHAVDCQIITKNTPAVYRNMVIPLYDGAFVSFFQYSGRMSGNGVSVLKINPVKICARKKELRYGKIFYSHSRIEWFKSAMYKKIISFIYTYFFV